MEQIILIIRFKLFSRGCSLLFLTYLSICLPGRVNRIGYFLFMWIVDKFLCTYFRMFLNERLVKYGSFKIA